MFIQILLKLWDGCLGKRCRQRQVHKPEQILVDALNNNKRNSAKRMIFKETMWIIDTRASHHKNENLTL